MSRWDGALEIGDGWARWHGLPGDASLHAHSAAQAVLGDCEAEDAAGGRQRAPALLIDPRVVHRLHAVGAVELLFVEPWATALPTTLRTSLDALPADTPRLSGSGDSWWTGWRAASAVDAPAATPWSQAARDFIEARLPDGRIGLDALAAHLHLSPDHARHRLAAALGLPFKRYVLWRRLRLAALAIGRGSDATAAAHESGFADSAHLARTLRAMFGVTITQALRSA